MTLTKCSITANYYVFQQGKVTLVKEYVYTLTTNLNRNFSQPVCEGYVLNQSTLFPISAMNVLGPKYSLSDIIPGASAARNRMSTIIHISTIARISCEKFNQYKITYILMQVLRCLSSTKSKRKYSKYDHSTIVQYQFRLAK
jgi:hypothetical protein